MGYSPQTHHPPQISVYDEVMSSSVADTIHTSTEAVGLGHRAFARPLKAGGTYNTIERALDYILTEMEDDNNDKHFVEYWARQEWRNIEAHVDIDEFRANEEDAAATDIPPGPDGYRYPKYGHVMYLKVGSNVSGPTCVWPGHRSGGELL